MRVGFAFILILCMLHSVAVAQDRVRITLFHTADVHGHLEPLSNYRGESDVGGLLRCAGYLAKTRPGIHDSLLVDCGDLFQGTAVSYLSKGDAIAEVVKLMNYDALVVGNHEFDWDLSNLTGLYRKMAIPVLAGNVAAPGKRIDRLLPGYAPFILRKFQGVKIAVIGLTTPNIPYWSLPEYLGGLEFEQSVPALRRIIAAVRDRKADIIVVAAHQGYREYGDDHASQINAIAGAFPEIDVILGAHVHVPVECEIINGVLYSQAGPYATSVGRVDLVYDRSVKRLVSRKATLVKMDHRFETPDFLPASVRKQIRKEHEHLSTVVGRTKTKLSPEQVTPGQSAAQTLIASAIAEATHADVVLHSGLSSAVVRPGQVKMWSIHALVPFENRIVLADLTPAELAEILEENAKYFGKDRFHGAYGFTYELEKNTSGDLKVTRIMLPDGSEPTGKITVAANSYDVASAGGRRPVLRRIFLANPETRLTAIQTRDAVVDYVKRHSPLSITSGPGCRVKQASH